MPLYAMTVFYSDLSRCLYHQVNQSKSILAKVSLMWTNIISDQPTRAR